MNYEVYIIKKGTPESKLLSIAGFNRSELEVVSWEGVKKRNGGYGKAPVSWRLKGVKNVEKLCLQVVKTLSNKKDLTVVEQEALNRASRSIIGINKQRQQKNDLYADRMNKIHFLKQYLQLHNIESDKIQKIVQIALIKDNFFDGSLAYDASAILSLDIKAINEARRMFKKIMY